MSAPRQLPPGFEALEPFAPSWALATAALRAQRRNDSNEAERQAFYQAASALLPQALAHLDAKPIAQFNEAEQRLMQVLLSFAHVALAVESQGDDESKHADARRHMRITQAIADRAPQ